jgi:putative CocE/NonD family hydrolase
MTTNVGQGLPFRIQLDVKVPMSDGVRLSADVYRPFGEGPFPALLLHTPYNNQDGRYLLQYVPRFVQAGYAVVLVDSRGRHDSEGEWYAYVNEGKDGFEIHEWLGRRPWCNGKIGTFGESYPGGTQIWAAPYHSQFLKALVPTFAQVDNYSGMAYVDGGAFSHSWGLWHIGMAGKTMQGQAVSLMNKLELSKRLPLISALDDICDSPAYRDAIRHYTHDELWKSYGVQEKYGEIDAPAYFINSWYNTLVHDNFKMFQGWRNEARSEEARKYTKLLVGPWAAGGITAQVGPWHHGAIDSDQPPGDIGFGGAAYEDILAEHIRWYDRRLKGIDNGIDDEPPIKLFIMGDNVWRYENEWPLARTRYTDYYLHSGGRANSLHGDGTLSRTPPADEPADHYSYNPEDPVPTIGGQMMDRDYQGPRDRRVAERRNDVLVFTSEVLEKEVEVTGPVTVTVHASSSARDTDFTATLVDVHPDGKAINITEGVIRARFRQSLERPSLLQPGRTYEFKIGIWETANVFKAGHRICLEISSSNFPRFDRNLNTGHQPGLDVEMRIAEQTIYHDSEHPSHITLPIIPRA